MRILFRMCIWVITACLSLAANHGRVYVPVMPLPAPPPILVPTLPPPTTLPSSTSGNVVTFPPTASSAGSTSATTPGPTNATTVATTAPTAATTAVPTTLPTTPPATPPPTFATTGSPTTVVTPAPTTLPTLTPVTSLPTTGITPPPGVTPTQQPIPNIDPRSPPALTFKSMEIEPLVRFGNIDYQDIVVEADFGEEPIKFPTEMTLKRKRRQATGNCGCFLPAQCPINNTDGTGVIDFRIVSGGNNIPQCLTGLRYCCIPLPPGTTIPPLTPAPTTLPPITPAPTTLPPITPAPTTMTTVTPIPQQSCGSRIQSNIIYPTQAGQARYGDYPWMVVILTTDNFYVGGGVLIDTQHVLTAAHRIMTYPSGAGLKIRLGEWDAAGNYEQFPYRDFQITRVWTHESFNPNNLFNDLSLIRITGGVPPNTPAIIPICLPIANQTFDNQRCWVSGWGKNSFGITGLYQTVLKSVDVPIIPQSSCETQFRATRLGANFILERPSFICAGGELNKDACTGDGGSGLVCESTPGRWTLAGLVAWGLGCASQGVPGAYVNIVNYLPWIATKVATV